MSEIKKESDIREIKFRGKRLDDNEWVYGYTTVSGKDGQLAWIITEGYEATYGPNHDQNIFRVDPSTVGQYTGLKDKTRRQIYDHDIAVWLAKDGRPVVREIFWIEAECRFAVGEYMLTDAGAVRMEIIGNIYKNPELLATQ